MVRDYELMYIVRPDLDEDGLKAATESVETLINGLGGSVLKTTMWGKRRLAYEVKHLRDGHYVICHVQLDGAKVADLERALRIHDTVFRHLLVLRDETGEEQEGEEGAEATEGAETEDGESRPRPRTRARAEAAETETEATAETEAETETEAQTAETAEEPELAAVTAGEAEAGEDEEEE